MSDTSVDMGCVPSLAVALVVIAFLQKKVNAYFSCYESHKLVMSMAVEVV